MERRRWKDLSEGQRAVVAVLGAVQVALLAAAEFDLARRAPDQVRGPKVAWQLVCLINTIGPLLYFWRGRLRR
ncbi:MAG TPA: hypothetical protein VFP89_01130 [Propionibacteriaceae bacterium]|nr:hypothetical protein [Propionibacteriaceae bacterium]